VKWLQQQGLQAGSFRTAFGQEDAAGETSKETTPPDVAGAAAAAVQGEADSTNGKGVDEVDEAAGTFDRPVDAAGAPSPRA
jgi:hypothetical protein